MPGTPVPSVVEQHAAEAAGLYHTRMVLLRSAALTLGVLRKLDERLAAHLDGLAIASSAGWRPDEELVEQASPGDVFCAAIRAIEERDVAALERLLVAAEKAPGLGIALIAAFEWVDPSRLRGSVAAMIASPQPVQRLTALAACAAHRVEPGLASSNWLTDQVPAVRSRALRAVGELGLTALRPACHAALSDDDAECRGWAAWSAVLLGVRGAALDALGLEAEAAPAGARDGDTALRLALQAMEISAGHALLQRRRDDRRALIQGSGIVGDPKYVPWLISQMQTPATARLAGEAFSLITGADLDLLSLDAPPPVTPADAAVEADDADVEVDSDEGLPWPDPVRVGAWWERHQGRFAAGSRFFLGGAVSRENCVHVLTHGYQRQRILAAQYLCLLSPGTPLFNVTAPAWRQQRQLAQLA